jgi:hypothetical protein
VGINYIAAGHGNGISLGGTSTTGTTEAQICWNCHNGNGVSEWGTNDKAATGNSPYHYGQIYSDAAATVVTSNWLNAYWKSSRTEFAYKTGQIQSMHAAGSAGLSGVDAVANLRCSYCHDVHELARAPGDTKAGKPYLRGSWKGNPYREDGAPRSGAAGVAPSLNLFGAVPRGGVAHTEYGGFQIDQNNGNPTAGWTANDSAGLCELCHGSGNAVWTAAEVNTLNKFGTAGPNTAWIGTNGHANSTLGGSGTASGLAANIFRESLRRSIALPPYPATSNGQGAGNPMTAYMHNPVGEDLRGFGFRSVLNDEDEGWDRLPSMVNAEGRPYGWNGYDWGATVRVDTTTDDRYHKFSCSKCHNPHASRLPRLLITNCLDTKHNTWDDVRTGIQAIPATGTANIGNTATVSADNGGVTWSNSTSAQNCHRVRDPNLGKTAIPTGGWNRVSPWTTAGTQDNGTIP